MSLTKPNTCSYQNTQTSYRKLQLLTAIFQEYVLENPWIPNRPHPVTKKSRPTPKQAKFLLLLDCLEALFGGAAGGGKSDALLIAAAGCF